MSANDIKHLGRIGEASAMTLTYSAKQFSDNEHGGKLFVKPCASFLSLRLVVAKYKVAGQSRNFVGLENQKCTTLVETALPVNLCLTSTIFFGSFSTDSTDFVYWLITA